MKDANENSLLPVALYGVRPEQSKGFAMRGPRQRVKFQFQFRRLPLRYALTRILSHVGQVPRSFPNLILDECVGFVGGHH